MSKTDVEACTVLINRLTVWTQAGLDDPVRLVGYNIVGGTGSVIEAIEVTRATNTPPLSELTSDSKLFEVTQNLRDSGPRFVDAAMDGFDSSAAGEGLQEFGGYAMQALELCS